MRKLAVRFLSVVSVYNYKMHAYIRVRQKFLKYETETWRLKHI